jgi:uncharacterized membrane-anchored protein YitT (DUF2179 family)
MPNLFFKNKSFLPFIKSFLGILVGTFLAALSIRLFLFPHNLIDGGIVGIALILGRLLGSHYLSYFLISLNLPFIFLAYKYIRKSFVLHMFLAVIFFALFLSMLETIPNFEGDILEIIVFGGVLLGGGIGLIIRNGGCTDGTEILGIIINRKFGFTVGQFVLFINVFIFSAYGWVFSDWHSALQSLMTYLVAFKMIDIVIAGLEEMKSVLIITKKPKPIKELVTHELGLGMTIFRAIGGFSGEDREILYIIIERLDLSQLKEIVLREDPSAFMAIENLHEVVSGRQTNFPYQKRKKRLFL